ncbi:hypothetical protein MG293_009161, partial [Ovis ammon polii]
MTSSRFSVFRAGISFVMMCIFYTSAVDSPELSPQTFFSTLQPGKATLVYFCQAETAICSTLLSVKYNLLKVNCVTEETSKYCGSEKDLMKAYLFSAYQMFLPVISVCFSALLFNEVKYITTLGDLQNIENALKGKRNIAFSYVRAIGTPEHRAVMEAAFVYGTTYQFVLTTEIALLQSIGPEDIEYPHLYFFHCKPVLDLTQPCRRILMKESLTTLNIHRFIKTMEAPLLTEVAGDPRQVSTVHLQLGLPLVFIVGQQATYEADRTTAEWVAWRLLGKAGVLLLLRYFKHGMVYSLFSKTLIFFLVMCSLVNKFKSLIDSNIVKSQLLKIQDDEVEETVYRDRKRQLPLELTVELTEETFHATVTASDSIVLFYAGCTSTMLLARVNCADWPHVCTKQNVTEFPVVKMYKEGQNPVSYTGMLGTEDLLRFIQLNRISCPVNITSVQEAEEYLNGELYKDLVSYSSMSVLGLFSPTMTRGKSSKYTVTLPALLLARHKEGKIESIPLVNVHVQDIVQIITNASLETFPEITVENLPTYLRLQKPLLILFSDGGIDLQHEKTILRLAKKKYLDSVTPCWLNLKKTPVGRGVLQAYFGTLPPLPLLVVVNLHSGGHVFAFPSDQAVTKQNLLLWLKKLEAGLESPIKVLPAEEWKPPLPAYDFLSMMDAAASEHLAQKVPECIKETDVHESDKEQPDDKSATTEESIGTLKMKHSSRSSWFEETKKPLR